MRYLLAMAWLFGAVLAYAGDSQGRGSGQMPKVYDAQGKYVGQLSNIGDGVYLTINGAVTFVAITRVDNGIDASATQFQWGSAKTIYYASSDCSGPAIIPAGNGPRPSVAGRVGADVVLYVAGTANSTTLHAGSMRQAPDANACFSDQNSNINQAFATETTYPLTQEHPEPLTIQP